MGSKRGKVLGKSPEANKRTVHYGMLGAVVIGSLFLALGAGRNSGDASSNVSGNVLVVPGGGLTAQGEPNPWVLARLQKAAELYHSDPRESDRPTIITLSGGTPHKAPPRDARDFPISEAASGAKHLMRQLKVPAEQVQEEPLSLDTIGNAYFLRAMHTDPANWRDLTVITNDFHMPRTRAIFEWVFSLPPLSPKNPTIPPYRLSFVSVPDEGMDEAMSKLRRDREAASLKSLDKTKAAVGSLRDLHQFIFISHNAYSTKRHNDASEQAMDPSLKSTY